MKRLKLNERVLPDYTRGEEIMNMVTHIAGGGIGLIIAILCCFKAFLYGTGASIIGCIIFAISIVALYAMSSIYHGLKTNTSKKVMQILDHCTIYFLICGTYTAILLSAFLSAYPGICIGLLIFLWALAALAITLTAIDLKKYNIFSMICYICMGWSILPFIPQTMNVLTKPGFMILLSGGIAYTIGAVLYGIGSKKPWFHSIFHIFVVIGSALQALSILLYAI